MCDFLKVSNIFTYAAGSTSCQVNSGNPRTTSEICSKLTRRQSDGGSSVFIINFGQISKFFLVFALLILSKQS